MLRSPEVMSRARAMGDYLRFRSSLPPRLSEFVDPADGAPLDAAVRVERARAARDAKAGSSADIVKAIADGRRPERMAEDEEMVYTLFDEIQRNQA